MAYMTPKPIHRSNLRLRIGSRYFRTRRWFLWHSRKIRFAKVRPDAKCKYQCVVHSTPLFRNLKDVDMWLQENKVHNLRIAVANLNGVVLMPGETFSYWKCIGNPTRRKGYMEGMLLKKRTHRSEHFMQGEFWGGHTRHNVIRRKVFDLTGNLIDDQYVTENHAIMMYNPLLEKGVT